MEHINITNIFIETHNEYKDKYKNIKHGTFKLYSPENIFNELVNFTSNSVYWSRYNKKKNNKKNCVSGKYLNQIHLSYSKHNFYETLYTKLLDIYFKVTNYTTLKLTSMDSPPLKGKY